jgi:hypothetical protein
MECSASTVASRSAAATLARQLPLLGMTLMLLAGVLALRDWRYLHAHVRATATVEENVVSIAPKGGLLYTPRLCFRLESGKLIHVLGRPNADEPEDATGTTLPVMYPAGDPAHATIATVWKVYSIAIVLGVLGVAIFDFGWILRLRIRSVPVFGAPPVD